MCFSGAIWLCHPCIATSFGRANALLLLHNLCRQFPFCKGKVSSATSGAFRPQPSRVDVFPCEHRGLFSCKRGCSSDPSLTTFETTCTATAPTTKKHHAMAVTLVRKASLHGPAQAQLRHWRVSGCQSEANCHDYSRLGISQGPAPCASYPTGRSRERVPTPRLTTIASDKRLRSAVPGGQT